MRTLWLAVLLLLSAFAFATQDPKPCEGARLVARSTPPVAGSRVGYTHGTIDVVISTRQGFVLATDSCGTNTRAAGITYSQDVQKLFPIGNRTAAVIAGLVGAEIGAQGFDVREAIGTSLSYLNSTVNQGSPPITAMDVARDFVSALDGVGGLLSPVPASLQSQVGQLSVVTVKPDNSLEWISFTVPLQARFLETGGMYLSTGTPTYSIHSTYLGPRFDVEVLGEPDVAYKLLNANRPTTDKHSRSAIMLRYYFLKRQRRLDQTTLQEGIALSKELLRATVDTLPPDAGVGGPIDVATVTKAGFHWVDHKRVVAELPPPRPRVYNSDLRGATQELDGFQWIYSDFRDARLFYAGRDDVQLIGSVFGGSCRLAIAPDAEQRRPDVVIRLRELVRGKCTVTVQRSNYP